MSKRKQKNSLKNTKKLSVQSFLKFCGIEAPGVTAMTHEGIQQFFPQLKRTSFAYVQKNPELVSTGQIVMVEDVLHYQVPYWMPKESFIEETTGELIGFDEREQAIQNVTNLLDTAIQNHFSMLLVIEGDESLDPYLFHDEDTGKNFLIEDCLEDFLEASKQGSGLILQKDFSLKGYQFLNHGDRRFDIFQLPPLERQAVGVTNKTDAIAVLLENEQLKLIVDGKIQELENKEELQLELLKLFPYEEPAFNPTTMENSKTVDTPMSYELSEMSNYELDNLMKIYRASNQMAFYHIVRRELVKRTKPCKEHRKAKADLKLKELLPKE